MDKLELLDKIRKDRTDQTIHEIISFRENKHGFYDVTVDMKSKINSAILEHSTMFLPYPKTSYDNLTFREQIDWMMNNKSYEPIVK